MKVAVGLRIGLCGLLLLLGWNEDGFGEGLIPLKKAPLTPAGVEFNKGVDSFTSGNLAAAEGSFKRSLELDPGMVSAFLGLAEVANQRGKPTDAGIHLQKALALGPQISEVHHAYGRYLFSAKKDHKGAEASLKKAASLNTTAVAPLLDLADLYMIGFKEPAKAVETYEKVLVLEPAHAGAHYGLGNAQFRLLRFDPAEKEFRRASELQPQNPLPTLALARLYATRNEADKAVVAYDAVLKLVPKSLEALIEKGDVLFATRQNPKALQSYKTALGYAPGNALVQLKIGMVEQDQGNTSLAEGAYKAAIKADPRQAVAYNNLAWMAAERKVQLAEALTWAQKAVSLDPKVPAFHGTLGWVYRARGETDKAVTSLEQASALAPNQPDVLYRLGMVYSEKGLRDKAIAALKTAVASKSSFKELDDAKKLLTRLETSR